MAMSREYLGPKASAECRGAAARAQNREMEAMANRAACRHHVNWRDAGIANWRDKLLRPFRRSAEEHVVISRY